MLDEYRGMRRFVALSAAVGALGAIFAACTRPNPTSCRDGTCSDPSLPYCDTEGVFGAPLTCVATRPEDAAMPDGVVQQDAMIDAPLEVPVGPKLWLKFDDDPADGVVDSASPAHTAACNASCPTLVAGKKGSAYQFTADRIDVTNTDLNPGQKFTISAWIRLDTSTTENSVGVCELVGSNCSYGLFAALNNKPAWYSEGATQTTGTTTLAVGTWYHSLMVWDGTKRITYLNGVMFDTQPAVLTSNGSTRMTIGARDFSSPLNFPGSIDEVLFYDRVLTSAEIQLLAQP